MSTTKAPLPRGNKSRRDKDSILVDSKNLLIVLYPAIERMPKAKRVGSPEDMKRAALDIIRYFSIAKACEEDRYANIQKMIGSYGILTAALDLTIAQGLLTARSQYRVCEYMTRMEEGVMKWKSAVKSHQRQAQAQGSGECLIG